ncbi:MAG TPA: serine/threonine-protein kinase [Candidatus Acidoferrales bacterium]|nr:serine/threonine-protein kinase [Candidatus Acidoferrales bacterium]
MFGKQPPNERRQINDKSEIVPIFKKGDLIGGEYEICDLVGIGGFGEVYLAYDRATESFCAFKTIRPDKFADDTFYEAFRREALLWVKLEQHPFILGARSALNFSGRLFVITDYVAPDERGRTSLLDHLVQARGPLNLDVALTWAIQFCHGMEHAHRCGITCHRDIKPANILITRNGTPKITDFGLAVAADAAWKSKKGSSVNGKEGGSFGLSLMQSEGRRICGTPGYIAPELFLGKEADTRSDVYSFGLVLWQMAAGSPLPPFHISGEEDIEKYLRRVYQQQIKGRIPAVGDPLQSIVERCLVPEPSRRYGTFGELRRNLEPIFQRRTGQVFKLPRTEDLNKYSWNEKGNALLSLGKPRDALDCYEKALEVEPRDTVFLSNKANVLNVLDKPNDAIDCCNQALEVDSKYAPAWNNKGNALQMLGKRELIVSRYNNTHEGEPQDSAGWTKRGYALLSLEYPQDAIPCFDEALEIDPVCAAAWSGKGNALNAMARTEEAINCCNKALQIDPGCAPGWSNKGNALAALGRREEAMACNSKALDIDRRSFLGQTNKGSALLAFGLLQEAVPDKCGSVLLGIENLATAIDCYDKALELEPSDLFTWRGKGDALGELGLFEEALACYGKVLEIDQRYASGWCDKGDTLRSLGRGEEAMGCYDKALEINPRDAQTWRSKFSILTELRRYEEAVACLANQVKAEQMIDPQFAPLRDERPEPSEPVKSVAEIADRDIPF